MRTDKVEIARKKSEWAASGKDPDLTRRRLGAFFTPTLWVDEAHKTLDRVLGPNWREECVVWDPAAGTGNLTRDYTFSDLILSTVEKPDVDVIIGQGYNPGASVFQFDFLNPNAASSFFVDARDKNEIPDAVDARLRAASVAGKRLVFLMNPPYGTANNAGTVEGDHKAGIALTAVNAAMKKAKIGASSQQLYAQFMYQCSRLAQDYGFKQTTVAVFSPPGFMCSGSYKGFRDFWYGRYAYQAGMMFQASHFADVSGRWGVSFTVWSEGATDPKAGIHVDLKDVPDGAFAVTKIGDKAFYNADGREASKWVREPLGTLPGLDAPQMSSGLACLEKTAVPLSSGALGYMLTKGNGVMENGTGVAIVSSSYTSGHGCSVLHGESWRRAIALYAARKLIAGNWINDKDEYLAPETTSVKDTGPKALYNSDDREASAWAREPLGKAKGVTSQDAPQMKSGLVLTCIGAGKLPPGSLGFFANDANNVMQSGQLVFLLSGAYSRGLRNGGGPVLPSNFRRAIALYGARKLVPGNWINDKDEYLQPAASPAYEQWNDDCHVYALLHNSNNCTAMRNVPYKGKSWTIHNHFFWKTHAETLAALDTPVTAALYRDCKQNPAKDVFGNTVVSTPDPYLASVLPNLNLSAEAKAVLDKLDALWVKSLHMREAYAAGRPELHLMSWDAGLFQLKHIWRDLFPVEWADLQTSFKALADKLRPGVYEHGFLKP